MEFLDDIRMCVTHKWKWFLQELIVYCKGIGAAYGTAKSGIGIAGVGTFRPDLIMKV